MIVKLETPNLVLRKAAPRDLDAIWRNVWSDAEVQKTMMWPLTKTRAEAENRLERTIKYQSEHYGYFVCLKSTDEAIGFAGVCEEEEGIYSESGICIARKYQGRGYGREVVAALKTLVFEKLCGKRFIYSFCKGNEKSKRLCISQGFEYSHTKTIKRECDGKEFEVDCYVIDVDKVK